MIKEVVKRVYKWGNVKQFFLKESELYKEAKCNDLAKPGLIREAINFAYGVLQFVFFRNSVKYEKVRKTYLK